MTQASIEPTRDEDWPRLLSSDDRSSEAAITELRELLRRRLAKALRGRAGVDDAFLDDAAQEATLRVLQAVETFRGESRFTTWATTIAVRTAFTILRRERWRNVSLEQMVAGEDGRGLRFEPADPGDAPDAQATRAGVMDVVRRVLDTELTERQRTALLAELEGMASQEIAARLGTNRNALYKLIHDARKKLKQGVLNAGLSEDDVRSAFNL